MKTARRNAGERVTLGLGGNIGDPKVAMAQALEELARHPGIDILSVSRLYRTPPWGPVEQDWFLNCCAMVETSFGPHKMLETILSIESMFRRQRTVRWGPRTIDIDLLTYGSLAMETDTLIIPHPRMLTRAFVMLPLSEIAGDLVIEGRTVSDWAASCEATGIEFASEDGNWWRGSGA